MKGISILCRKWKKGVAGALCLVMLAVCGMSVYAACNHLEVEIASDVFSRYENVNSSSHTRVQVRSIKCSNCGELIDKNVEVKIQEGHRYYRYDNLGHSGRYHAYKLHCDCGYSMVVTIPCDNSGSHSTPW